MKEGLILWVIAFLIIAFPAFGQEEFLLHKDIPFHFRIVNDPKDTGTSALMVMWLNQIRASQKISEQKKQAFSDLFRAIPRDIEGGIDGESMVIVAPFTSRKGSNISLKDVLGKIIRKDSPLEGLTYKGYAIYYDRAGEVKSKLSAFSIGNGYAILASNTAYVKRTIDALGDRRQRLLKDSEYKEILAKLPFKGDGILLADNKDQRFLKVLKGWEKKWKMTILLSAPYLDSLVSSFDIVDENRVRGVFIFKSSRKERIQDVVDDASFLGEVLKRRFIKEKIRYTSKIDVEGPFVSLGFEIEGLKPLWAKLFNQ